MASHESQLTFIAYTVIIILNTGILANKSADRLSIISNRNDSGSIALRKSDLSRNAAN